MGRPCHAYASHERPRRSSRRARTRERRHRLAEARRSLPPACRHPPCDRIGDVRMMRVAGVARSTRRERDRRMADDRRRDADTALGDRPRRLRQQPRTAPRPLREPGHGPHPAGLQGRWQEQLARRRRGPNVPCRGLTPGLATPHPGSSPNREWMISRTRPITHSGNGNRGTATRQRHPRAGEAPTAPGYQTGTSVCARPHPRRRARLRIARNHWRSIAPQCPRRHAVAGSHPGGRGFESP